MSQSSQTTKRSATTRMWPRRRDASRTTSRVRASLRESWEASVPSVRWNRSGATTRPATARGTTGPAGPPAGPSDSRSTAAHTVSDVAGADVLWFGEFFAPPFTAYMFECTASSTVQGAVPYYRNTKCNTFL